MQRTEAPEGSPSHPAPASPPGRRRHRWSGFTLVEVLLIMAIVGILASLAVPRYGRVKERAFVARAIGDIESLQQDIADYYLAQDALPTSLADVGRGGLTDPWGNAYQYLPITDKGKGGFRKDRFLVPINSDYDLYSQGPDGESAGPLSAKKSQDDVIRANNGGFIGLASDF